MLKRKTKKASFALTTAILAASISFSGIANAADSVYSDPMGANGYIGYGSVVFGNSSATAYTSFPVTAGIIAKVTYNYKWGNRTNTETVTANKSAGSTSVSATALSKDVPAMNVSAYGQHTVSYNGLNWNGFTSITA